MVGQSQVSPCLSPTYTDLGSSLSGIRLAGEQGEIRTGSKTGFQLHRLPVPCGRGQGQTHTRALQALRTKIQAILSCPVSLVQQFMSLIGLLTATEKQVHLGRLYMRPIQGQLSGTRITRKSDSSPQVAQPSLKMVAGGKQCASRSTITPTKICSA